MASIRFPRSSHISKPMASRFARRLPSTSKHDAISEDNEGRAMKIAFVVAEFNSEVTFPMEKCARRHAESLGVEVSRVIRVPGVYDMGPVVKALLGRKEIDGVVMIGAVIKGETNHAELISHAIAPAGITLSLDFEIPVRLV